MRTVNYDRLGWIGSWRLGAVALLAALAFGASAPQGARASTSLVITPPGFSSMGLVPASSSPRAATRTLAAGLSSSVATAVGLASAQATGAAGRGEHVSSDAFVFRSKSVAASVLRAWRHAHHARKVAVGGGGALGVGHPRGQVEVLWRDGPRLGLIVLRVRHAGRSARATAMSLAFVADPYLRSPLPRTAWQKVLDQIRPNGTVSRVAALQAFAVAYGGLPGVRAPTGPRGTIASGTLAEQWILEYRSRLSAAQHAVVDRRLGLEGASNADRPADLGDPTFRPDGGIEAIANEFAKTEGADLGHTLGLTIVAGYSDDAKVEAFADSLPLNAKGDYGSGSPATCRIRVLPAERAASVAFLRLTIAHEVFHCFEFDLRGAATWTPLPAWIGEGAADWAALTVDPIGYGDGGGNLTSYITTPQTPLFSRSYDAVGFWGHVQDTVGGLWTRFSAIFNAGNDVAAYDAAGANSDAFLASWGSSPFRIASAGPEWNMASPINVGAGDAVTPVETIDTTSHGFADAPPYTTGQYVVITDPSTPLLYVAVVGHARLSSTFDYTDLDDAWFCTDPQGCTCPKGTSGELPPTRPLTPTAAFGLTGDPDGGRGSRASLDAYPLSKFCKPAKTPNGGGGGGGGGSGSAGSGAVAGGSGGDPHLYDFDGGPLFDFQQAGEFTLLKSTDDDLDIQVRQQPLSDCCVAFNTAVAMRAGHDTVEVDQTGSHILHTGGGAPVDIGGATVYVNNAPVHGSHVTLGGGAELSVGSSLATVTWPDGTTAAVGNGGSLYVTVTLAPDRFGHVEGLLGNARVPADREFPGANGRLYPASVITGTSPHDVNVRYGQFGASWRITQGESLFHYPAGKSTRSYTVAGFPAKYETVASLPAPKRAAAEKACRAAGITSGPALDGCVVDVGVTGDGRFAGGDARLRHAVLNPVLTTPVQAAVVPLGSIADSYSPPRIVVDAAGQGYTSWADGGSGAALDYCRLPQGATSCASRLSFAYPSGGDQGSDSGNAPVFTADGQLALVDSRCCLAFQKFLLLSSDGGQTFTAPTPIVSDDASGMTGNVLDLPPGALFPGSPEQLLTSDNGADTDGGSIQATGLTVPSTDPGWFAPAPSGSLSESIGLQGSTLVAVVTNPTSPYSVSWVRYLGVGDPNVASSWSSPQTLSPAPSLESNAQLAGGPAGIFVVRSIATSGDNEQLVLQKFTGSGWTSPVAIASDVDGERFAIDQTSAGIVYVIWTNSSGSLQYAIATSTAATQFGAPHTLPTRGDVEYPQIAVDAKGAGWATWTNGSSPDHAFALPITPN